MSSSANWWGKDLLQLRDELKSKGLDVNGSKPVLVRRLETYEDSYKKRIEALKAKSKPVAPEGSPVKASVQSSGSKPTDKIESPAKMDQNTSKQNDGSSKSLSTSKETSVEGDKTESKQAVAEEKSKDWWSMSMQELKNECSNRGLSFMGNKYTLVNRLKTYEDYQAEQKKKGITPVNSSTAVTTTNKSVSSAAKLTTSSAVSSNVRLQKTGSITSTVTTKTTTNGSTTEKEGAVTPQKPSTKDPNLEKYERLTFAQLKIECVNKKLDITGTKPDLINRLMKWQEKEGSSKKPGSPVTTPAPKPLETRKIIIKTPSPRPSITRTTNPTDALKLSQSTTEVKSQSTPVSVTRITAVASKPANSSSWSPAAQKLAAISTPSTPPVKKILTFVKSIQTDPVPVPKKPYAYAKGVQTVAVMKRQMGSQTISITEEVEKVMPVKTFFADEHVEIAKKFSTKLPQWDGGENQLPDLTVEYEQVKMQDEKSKTIIAYPLAFKDLQDPKFTAIRQTAKDVNIGFQDPKTVNKSIKGSVTLKFFTYQAAEFAVSLFRSWRRDIKVERLIGKADIDEGLKRVGAKLNRMEPLVNRILFLNKLPMKLKEGDLAEKFSDAVSITIARDALNVSKGYGFVEYNNRNDAQNAHNRTKNLYLEGGRIEVKIYPKVPSDLSDEKSKLAMPDHERIRMAEQHHKASLDFNKAKSGPYNRDRSEEQRLLREMSVLEEKLAVDAAIRKKLNYNSLPEPAAYLSSELRRAWQTGNFSNFKVDLGKIHKSWEEPKFKDIKNEGPPPPKQSKYEEDKKPASGLAATLNQLKSMPDLEEERKRKDPLFQQQQGSWNQRNRQLPQQQNNRMGDQSKGTGWGTNQPQRNTWEQQQSQQGRGGNWNQQQRSFGNLQSSGNVPSLFDAVGGKKDSTTDRTSFGRKDSPGDFRKGGPSSWDGRSKDSGLPTSFGGSRGQDSDMGLPKSFGAKKVQDSYESGGLQSSLGGKRNQDADLGFPTSFGGRRNQSSDMGLPTSFGKKSQDSEMSMGSGFGRKSTDSDIGSMGLPMAFGKGNSGGSFGSGGNVDDEMTSAFGTGKSQIGRAMLDASKGGGDGRGRGGGFGRGGGSGRGGFNRMQDSDSSMGGFKDPHTMSRFGRDSGFPEKESSFGSQRRGFPDEMPPQSQQQFGRFQSNKGPQQQQQNRGGKVPGLFDTDLSDSVANKKTPQLSQDMYDKFYEGEDVQSDENALPMSFSGRNQGGGKSSQFDKGNSWGDDREDDYDEFSRMGSKPQGGMMRQQQNIGGFSGGQGRFDDRGNNEQDLGFGQQSMGRGRGRGGMMGRGGRFSGSQQQIQPEMEDMDLDEDVMQKGVSSGGSFNRGRISQIGGADESFHGDMDQDPAQFRRTPGARGNYGQDGGYGDTPKSQYGQRMQRGFGGRQDVDDQYDVEGYPDEADMENQGMGNQGQGMGNQGQGMGNQGQGMRNQGQRWGNRGMGSQGMEDQGMRGQGMGNQGMRGQTMGNQGMRGPGMGNQGVESERYDSQGMRQGSRQDGQSVGRPGMSGSGMDKPVSMGYGQQQPQRSDSPSKRPGSGRMGQPPVTKEGTTVGGKQPGLMGQNQQSSMPKPAQQPQQQGDQLGYGYGDLTQPPPQTSMDPYSAYDQAAYEAYYGDGSGYDYSQYDYSQIDYSRYGQYDYTTGQWSHPYGDYNPQQSSTGKKSQTPQQPYSSTSSSGMPPQPPPPTVPPPSSGSWPATTGGGATAAEGDGDTVNVELVKKLSGAVTTLRQQMGYVSDQQTSQSEQTSSSSNMPAFVSNMAYSQQSSQQGLYSGLRQAGYLNS